MSIELEISGMDKTIDRLLGMPKKLRGQVIKRALVSAAKPIMRVAESKAPNGTGKGATGALKASMSYRVQEVKGSRGSTFRVVIGAKTKAGRPRPTVISRGPRKGQIHVNLPTRTAHMIEFGFTHVRGASRKQVAPAPFMRPAWQQEGGEKALKRVADTLVKEVEKL